jgi:hypothetical protein
LKNEDYIGEYVRALKIESNLSIEKFFNTSLKDSSDIMI